MKKFLILFLLTIFVAQANAQVAFMRVNLKDGSHVLYKVENVDSVDFITDAPNPDDPDDPNVPDTTSISESSNRNANSIAVCSYADRLEFPHLSENGHSIEIVHLTSDTYDKQGVNFCTEWDYELGSQRWSCYQMHSGFGGSWSRYDYKNDSDGDGRQYPWDADLDPEYYTATDNFYGSGFDHGHICPAADRNYSFLADKQTFYMTNMQPQYNAFNAGLWAKLESQIRSWTNSNSNDTIFVCKGTTIDNEDYIIKRINGKLIAPKYFYCALLIRNSQGCKTIAFWMENENVDRTSDSLGKYAISVDELEQKTGLDFFCNLPDEIEDATESSIDLSAWGLQ